MRSRRIQKRKATAAKTAVTPEYAGGYAPDLFGKENEDLVEAEAAREYECPCCTERQDFWWFDAYERWYLEGKTNADR